jgi:hypothetical protein
MVFELVLCRTASRPACRQSLGSSSSRDSVEGKYEYTTRSQDSEHHVPLLQKSWFLAWEESIRLNEPWQKVGEVVGEFSQGILAAPLD